MNGIYITLLAVALVLFLPVLLPVALVQHSLYLSRLRALANRFHCTNCERILGLESLRLADAAESDRVAQLRREHPGARLRLNRTLHAICANCGQPYTFLEKENNFIEEVR